MVFDGLNADRSLLTSEPGARQEGARARHATQGRRNKKWVDQRGRSTQWAKEGVRWRGLGGCRARTILDVEVVSVGKGLGRTTKLDESVEEGVEIRVGAMAGDVGA